MFFDPIYLLFLAPGMLLSFSASARVKSTFAHYNQVASSSGMSGAEAARELLRRQSIFDVRVEPVEGFLSDHYDPSSKTLTVHGVSRRWFSAFVVVTLVTLPVQ
jgi:Zn-dependent membrane protease YugP